ncbi:hypothetical protein ACX80O_03295 [Arthrobacter sp. Hz1]
MTLPSDLAAWVALAISLFLLLRGLLSNREAHLTARFHAESGKHPRTFIVISNHGPAEAREIHVSFAGEDGKEWVPHTQGHDIRKPIPFLGAGDLYRQSLLIPMDDHGLITLTLSWKDKRLKRQERRSSALSFGMPEHLSLGEMRRELDELKEIERRRELKARGY